MAPIFLARSESGSARAFNTTGGSHGLPLVRLSNIQPGRPPWRSDRNPELAHSRILPTRDTFRHIRNKAPREGRYQVKQVRAYQPWHSGTENEPADVPVFHSLSRNKVSASGDRFSFQPAKKQETMTCTDVSEPAMAVASGRSLHQRLGERSSCLPGPAEV